MSTPCQPASARIADAEFILGYLLGTPGADNVIELRDVLQPAMMPLQKHVNVLSSIYRLGAEAHPVNVYQDLLSLKMVYPPLADMIDWVDRARYASGEAFAAAYRRLKAEDERERAAFLVRQAADAIDRGGDPRDAVRIIAERAASPPLASAPSSSAPGALTAGELLALDIPDIRWFVPGVLREGLALLVGAPFVGKTPALVQLALALASGGTWLERFRCRPTRVLYVGTEYSRADVRKTLVDSLGRDDAPQSLYIRTVEDLPEFSSPAMLQGWLEAQIDATGAEVIILDVLTAILPAEGFKQNVYRGDYQELKPYHRLGLDRHICIVGAWHGSKRETDPAIMYNGSTGMWGVAGGGRLVLYKDKDKVVHLATYTRGGEALDLTLEQRLHNGWRRWIAAAEDTTPAGIEGVQRSVYVAIAQSDRSLGPGAVYDKVSELVPNLNSVKSALRQLVAKGLVTAAQGAYFVAQGDPRDLDDPYDPRDLRDPNSSQDVDHRDPDVIQPPAALERGKEGWITRITDHEDHAVEAEALPAWEM